MYALPEETRIYFDYSDISYSIVVDSLPKNKLWISYRHKDSDSWSEPIEAFKNDTLTARASQMPSIVPDLNNIPIVFFAGPPPNPAIPSLANLPRLLTSTNIGGTCRGYVIVVDAQYVSIEEGEASDNYCLENAYPNPVTNDEISFKFSLQKAGNTRLTIHNVMGQIIATVVDQYCNANEHTVKFNTDSLPVGTYYYTLTSDTRTETKMFNVIR
jgi:hypothetical protein